MPRRKLHVAVDLDDVCLDFMDSVMGAFHKEYGVRPEWDGAPWGEKAVAFGKHPLFLESGYASWWDWLRDREWLWANFPAIPGAIGGVKRLRAAGHYVECVTSKPEWAEHNVWKWLGKWRPSFNRVTIVTNGQLKSTFTVAGVIVDDKFETCLDFAKNDRHAIWFNRSRSPRQLGYGGLMHMAHDWEHVIKHVEELCTQPASTRD